MRVLLTAFCAVALIACGKTDNPLVCDPGQICDGGAGGGSASGGGTGGSGSSGGGSSVGGGSGGGSGGGAATGGGAGGSGGGSAAGGGSGGGGMLPDGGCTENWKCSYWQPDGGTAYRECADLNSCPAMANKPPTTSALPALNATYFKCNVQPAFARTCGMVGCHGTLDPNRPFRVFARGRQRNREMATYTPATYGCGSGAATQIELSTQASGTASCVAKVKLTATENAVNFDNARAFAIGLGANVDSSELLQQPKTGNGLTHSGIKFFKTGAEADYQTIRTWLDGGTLANCPAGNNN